jgi:hypothetical protein
MLWSYGVYLVGKPDNWYGRIEFIWSGNQTTVMVVWSLLYPRSPKGGGYTVLPLSVCPSVQDIIRRIFLSNC